MLEKLKQVEERFEEINRQLCRPEVVSDLALYRKLMQEQKHLTPVVETFRAYQGGKRIFLK